MPCKHSLVNSWCWPIHRLLVPTLRSLAWCTLAACSLIVSTVTRADEADGKTRTITIEGRKLHVKTWGEAEPTIIIEAGMGEPGASGGRWNDIAQELAKQHRVCLYDRAGLGESDPPPALPRTCEDLAKDLQAVVKELHLIQPCVLVAHSFAGLHVRQFAEMQPDQVAAVVLIDTSHPEQDMRWLSVIPAEQEGEPESVTQARDFLKRRLKSTDNPEHIDPQASYAQIAKLKGLGEKPLVILTHAKTFRVAPDLPENVAEKIEEVSAVMQAEFLKLSKRSSLTQSEWGGHLLHVDDPALVIKGIDQAVQMVTGQAPPARPRQTSAISINAIDEYLNYLNRLNKFAGVALIAQSDRVLLQQGYGWQDVIHAEKNRPGTIFRIYSVTKPFTATLVLQLAEQQKLKLSDHLSQYLPTVPRADTLTVEHLLTHTSGLPDLTQRPGLAGEDFGALVKFLHSTPADFAPGTRWQYSNTNYVLLGHLVAKLSGTDYATHLKQAVLQPLGMEHSGLDWEHLVDKNKAIGYRALGSQRGVRAAEVPSAEPFAAGALYATAGDLLKFKQSLTQGKLLRAETLQNAWKGGALMSGYGQGWQLETLPRLGPCVFHTGGAAGFNSLLSFTRQDDFTVILLSNVQTTDCHGVAHSVYTLLAGGQVPQPAEQVVGPEKLAEYMGIYMATFPQPLQLCVSVVDGRLAVNTPGGAVETVVASMPDKFTHLERNAQMTFQRNSAGQVASLSVGQGLLSMTLERQTGTWGLLGTATPQGWESQADLPLKETSVPGVWQAEHVRLSNGEIKLRYHNDWVFNYGQSSGSEFAEANGPNIPVAEGVYRVTLDVRDLTVPTIKLEAE